MTDYNSPFFLVGMCAEGFVVNVQAFSALLHQGMTDLCSSSVGRTVDNSVPDHWFHSQ